MCLITRHAHPCLPAHSGERTDSGWSIKEAKSHFRVEPACCRLHASGATDRQNKPGVLQPCDVVRFIKQRAMVVHCMHAKMFSLRSRVLIQCCWLYLLLHPSSIHRKVATASFSCFVSLYRMIPQVLYSRILTSTFFHLSFSELQAANCLIWPLPTAQRPPQTTSRLS